MAVKDIQAGALGVHQNSEPSENEIPVNTSGMEHQTASQVYLIPLDVVFRACAKWPRSVAPLVQQVDARTVGKRDHLIR